jgi:kynurenine formamidase
MPRPLAPATLRYHVDRGCASADRPTSRKTSAIAAARKRITADDVENSVRHHYQRGDRVLLRTDINKKYGGPPEWMAPAPYLSDGLIARCRNRSGETSGDTSPNY